MQNIDLYAVGAALLTTVVGIGAVGKFLTTWAPKINKVTRVAEDVTKTLGDFAAAFKPDADGKISITTDELNAVKADIAAILADIKA